MTRSDDPLTPEEEDVRRLLAGARHTGPTPPDVVARLDRVLADLSQEPGRVAPVVDLARRRRVTSLLVAAAAVVAVGVGVGQIVSPQSDSESTTAGDAGTQADNGLGSAREESKSGAERTTSGEAPAPATGDAQDKSGLLELRRDQLADDLTDLRPRRFATYSQPLSGVDSADRAVGAACGADQWGRGRFVPVSYGGTPAIVVFRRPVGDTQVVDLFLCGSEEPVRSVTLPAP